VAPLSGGTGVGRSSKKPRHAKAKKSATAPPPPPPPVMPSTSLRRNQVVRIGLTTDRERITISCGGAFRVTDPASGQAVWKDSYKDPLTVGIRGSRPTEGRIFRAQVGSFDKKDAAEEQAARLRTEMSDPVVVAWSPDRKVWRIRVGQ